MDSVCHTTVASCLLDYFQQTEGVSFDRKAFYFGNLKPDLKGEYLTKRHYPSLMYDDVMQKLDVFIETYRLEPENGAKLSEDLGEICHYLTDFFTFPHNDTIYNKNLLAHYIYEKRMTLVIRRQVNEQTFAGFAQKSCEWLPQNGEDLKREIAARHAAYTGQEAHGIADDIENVCGTLSLLLGSLIQMLAAQPDAVSVPA